MVLLSHVLITPYSFFPASFFSEVISSFTLLTNTVVISNFIFPKKASSRIFDTQLYRMLSYKTKKKLLKQKYKKQTKRVRKLYRCVEKVKFELIKSNGHTL